MEYSSKVWALYHEDWDIYEVVTSYKYDGSSLHWQGNSRRHVMEVDSVDNERYLLASGQIIVITPLSLKLYNTEIRPQVEGTPTFSTLENLESFFHSKFGVDV